MIIVTVFLLGIMPLFFSKRRLDRLYLQCKIYGDVIAAAVYAAVNVSTGTTMMLGRPMSKNELETELTRWHSETESEGRSYCRDWRAAKFEFKYGRLGGALAPQQTLQSCVQESATWISLSLSNRSTVMMGRVLLYHLSIPSMHSGTGHWVCRALRQCCC